MERGDLAVSVRPYYVVVAEGVLVSVHEVTEERRFRGSRVTGLNLHWLDLPLRRLATMRRQYPDYGCEVVTFHSQDLADQVAEFLETLEVPVDSVSYQGFSSFCLSLGFREQLSAVYDSDPDRLDRYGQVGKAVARGMDFS